MEFLSPSQQAETMWQSVRAQQSAASQPNFHLEHLFDLQVELGSSQHRVQVSESDRRPREATECRLQVQDQVLNLEVHKTNRLK